MHRTITLLIAIALAAPAALAQTALPHTTAPDGFQFLPASQVFALTDKPGPGAKTAFLADHETSFVEYAARTADGNEAEVHDHWIHYIHILEGEGTLVYGGTVANPRQTAPGQVRGSAITGGRSLAVHPGDYMQIPAGMPHLFNVPAGGKLRYIVFNIRQ